MHPAGWVAAGVAVADTVLAARGARRLRWVTKSALVPAIAAAAVAGGRELPPGLRTALVGSWAGDVALLSGSETGFLTGVAGFAVAHTAYLTEIRATRVEPGAGAAALAVAAAGTGAGVVLRRRVERRMRGPVLGYTALVTGMGAAAVATGRRGLGAGGALFVLSDGLVAYTRFGGRRRPVVEAAVMATYAAAQALLVAALSRPAPPPASADRARPRPGAARCRWSPTGR